MLHEKLNRLVALLLDQSTGIERNPPLAIHAIHTLLPHPYHRVIAACRDLYTWANGTTTTSAPLFWDQRFLSIQEALDRSQHLAGHAETFSLWNIAYHDVFVLTEWEGCAVGIYAGDIGPLRYPLLDFGEDLGIAYRDVAAMVDTCLAAMTIPSNQRERASLVDVGWHQHNAVQGDPRTIDQLMQQLNQGLLRPTPMR